MRKSVVIVGVLVAGVALAGCHSYAQDYPLRSQVVSEDGRLIFQTLLLEQAFKDVADRVDPVKVEVEIRGPGASIERFAYLYANGKVTNTDPGDADFTVTTSRDLALAVLNAEDDGFRVFACALKANAVTFEATNPVYAASFNAAKGRITGSATDCTAKDGQKVTYRQFEGTLINGSARGLPRHVAYMTYDVENENDDMMSFNVWRAPLAWHTGLCYDAFAGVIRAWCLGSGTTVASTDLTTCATAVEDAYGRSDTSGWDAGRVAAEKARKAAELAACKIVFKGAT